MDPEAELIASRLGHAIDLLRSELRELKSETMHYKELTNRRLGELETADSDHETRLRSLQDGVTTFKTWSGLASSGSSVMSIIALVRTIFTP